MVKQEPFKEAGRQSAGQVWFLVHLTAYLGVNAIVLIINLKTVPGRPWFLYPFIGWGFVVFLHSVKVFGFINSPITSEKQNDQKPAGMKHKKQMEEDG